VIAAWPRMMKLGTAAQYCDLSASAFLGEVAAARLPEPVTLGNRDHWDRLALDRALAILTGEQALPEWEQEFQARYG
jgi:hypothetical protein